MKVLFDSPKLPVGVTIVAVILAILATAGAYAIFQSTTSDDGIIYARDASPAVALQLKDILDKMQDQSVAVTGWETWPAKKQGNHYVVLMPYANGITPIPELSRTGVLASSLVN